ncbi:MAG: membrane protein insertase YidC [Lachnospiraceae bacterium]
MTNIILTQYSGKIIGPIAVVIGYIIDFIYNGLYQLFGLENIGLTILFLTIIVYLLLTPLTYKQQKFSKMSMKMNPELQELQYKYKGRTDQEARIKMQEETQAVYEKYGVSATGSCLQLFIQMPIFFALYRVIANVPAYVSSVKDSYTGLVDQIMATSGYQDTIASVIEKLKLSGVSLNFAADASNSTISNSIIDVLYKFPTHSWGDFDGWSSLINSFPNLTDLIETTRNAAFQFNSFIGLDIANSPLSTMKSTFSTGHYGLLILALMVPILSGLTQFLNLKLASTGNAAVTADNPMSSSMNMMNLMMPLVSVVMVLTLPIGLGIYWIVGAIVRSIQQVVINRHLDKVDFDKIVEKNMKKAAKKREKRGGYTGSQIASAATVNARSITPEEREKQLQQARTAQATAKTGSLASKANLVREFNEKNNK